MVKTIGIVVVGIVLGTGTSGFVLMKASSAFIHRLQESRKAKEEAKKPEEPWNFWTVEMEHLSEDLKAEKARLKERDEAIRQREARLQTEKLELENARKQLEAMRAAIDARLIEISDGEAANLKKLAQTYQGMPARNALAIYKEMDDITVVKLLSLMKNDIVRQVFEEMSRQSAGDPALAKRAATLSDKLRLMKAAKPPPSN